MSEAETLLKDLSEKVSEIAGKLDAAKDYNDRNVLDMTEAVLKRLIPVVSAIVSEQVDSAKLDAKHGTGSSEKYYALKANVADTLIDTIITEPFYGIMPKHFVTTNVLSIDHGFVVVAADNHVLKNTVFNTCKEAEQLKASYDNQLPSLTDNTYTIKEVLAKGNLQFGDFPYHNRMYFVSDAAV